MTLEEKEKAIIDYYKPRHQVKYMFGEVSELQEAITDYEYVEIYKGSPAERWHKEHIVEEVGDVQLMVNQFKRFYDISDEDIKGVMEEKADRQLMRIEEEKAKN